MSINPECGSNVRMPHQLLGGFFVHTGFIKQRSIGMPELMQCAADPRFSLEFLPAVPADIVRYWLPPGQRENKVICRADRGSDRAVPWEWDFADRLRLRRAEWSGHIGADVCRGVCSMSWGQPESLPLCWQSCCDRETGASLP